MKNCGVVFKSGPSLSESALCFAGGLVGCVYCH